jgi:NADPH:quinone reductase
MKAAYVTKPGPPESIIVGELPTPEPTGSQVLVRVNAAAVNPIDTYVRSGMIKMEIPLPYIVGADLAGVVEKLGPNAKKFKVGDRIWGTDQGLMGRQGTFAEYAAVEERWLYPIPAGVTDETAAACALVGITATLGLVRDANLQTGETLFVNGGTGGVGSMVVQMAKAIGARVITTAGSDEKLKLCREMGADEAINYKTEDVSARVKGLMPGGINVWWETVREPNFEQTIPLLAKRGRMILMAGRDAKPVFPVGPFYTKDCRLFGFAMFNATREEQDAAAAHINRWLAAGKLKPRIDRVLPLDKAAEAHRLQEESTVGKSGALAGKIVIHP